jgi:hypothetical protein
LRHYEALHDFAGPAATFFAGGVAILVTWTLGRRQVGIASRQAEIAAQQADTAQYRLRYDLFEKRYVIYRTTHEILDIMIRDGFHTLDHKDIAAKFRVLDEARFLFPPKICAFLGSVHHEVELATRLHMRHIVNKGTPDEQRELAGDQLEAALNRLAEIRRTLPARFEDAMNLARLSDNPASPPVARPAPR